MQGGLTRGEGQDRIDFLADVRNLALRPLWREPGAGRSQNSSESAGFQADRIVFINDVYFCVRDVVRARLAESLCSVVDISLSAAGVRTCNALRGRLSHGLAHEVLPG